MSARLLCKVASLRHISPLQYRQFLWTHQLHKAYAETQTDTETEEGDGGKDVQPQPQGAPLVEGYRLDYNPSSYLRPKPDRGTALSRGDLEAEEDARVAPSSLFPPPPFRKPGNHYSVSSSRRLLSSTKNTLLDLAFSHNSGPVKSEPSPSHRSASSAPNVKGDPRAFQRCRSEYSAMTLDLSRRPPAVQSKQAFNLLHRVTVLKGGMGPADVTAFLCQLSHLHPDQTPLVRGDTRFIMLLRYSVENLRQFTHGQILEALRSLVWLGLPPTHSMLGLYEAELGRRAGEMDLHQLLLAADLWRCLGRPVPQYLERLYACVSLHLAEVGVPELVQLVYVMGEGRRRPADLTRPLEQLLTRHLDRLEPEEVGAVCLGLFKSQTSLSEGLASRLVDRALSVVGQMSDFSLVNVMKLLRFSYLDHRPWLAVMAEEVPRRAPNMGVQGLMHVALACSALHYRDEIILLSIAERLPSLAPHCRSKDSGKLLWAFGTLGVLPSQCPDLYPSLVDALRSTEAEYQRYPEHLLTGLLGLAFVCQFPQDLLALALSPEFVNMATRSTQLELKKDLFTLDGTVALELPDWTGPRLSGQLREEVAETLWRYAQTDVCQKPEVLEAEAALKDLLGGEEFVSKRMIIPHTRTIDLEVHLDPSGRPVPVTSTSRQGTSSPAAGRSHPKSWERVNTGVTLTDDLVAQLTRAKGPLPPPPTPSLRPPPLRRTEPDEGGGLFSVGVDLTDGLVGALTKPRHPFLLSRKPGRRQDKTAAKLAIQVTNRNQYCYRSQLLLGLHAMKRRQLGCAGYQVVELPHWEWFPLLRKSRTEKLAYLHCKVLGRLD
ncbi:LOW QUALITY PROTEIN: FAST kinase domain-containing protein 5, mitochondrial [Aplochiton taeniatus]